MGRITINDTDHTIISQMCNHVIGAASVVHQMLVEPNGRNLMCVLDNNGIYGSDIWILYKNICGCKISEMSAVIQCTENIKNVKVIISQINAGEFPEIHLDALKFVQPDFTYVRIFAVGSVSS